MNNMIIEKTLTCKVDDITGEITCSGKFPIKKSDLRTAVEFWINEKNLKLTEDEKEKVIEEAIRRADELWEEEIEDIAEEVKW